MFYDGHAQSVRLEDLWSLYWHRDYVPPMVNITGEPNQWTYVQRSGNLKDWWNIWFGFMRADGLKQITESETNQIMFCRAVVPQEMLLPYPVAVNCPGNTALIRPNGLALGRESGMAIWNWL